MIGNEEKRKKDEERKRVRRIDTGAKQIGIDKSSQTKSTIMGHAVKQMTPNPIMFAYQPSISGHKVETRAPTKYN